MIRVPVLIINSSEFTLDACCLIENVVVFINQDISPVRNFDGLFHFCEDN
jgi:hypothetical protein